MPVIDIHAVTRAHTAFLYKMEQAIDEAALKARDHGVQAASSGLGANYGAFNLGTRVWKTRTGKLVRSIRGKVIPIRDGGRRVVLSAGAAHAEYIEHGTSPHFIRGWRSLRRLLRFKGRNGQWVFRRKVFHPGNKPYRFLSTSRDKAFERAGWRLNSLLHEIANKF